MSYTDSALHHITVAAIHTPYGQPIGDATAVHDAHCMSCTSQPELAHTCHESRGLTPAQLTDACPRCQQLLHR